MDENGYHEYFDTPFNFSALKRQLHEMDLKLKAKQDQLNVLHSYKVFFNLHSTL